MARAIETEVSPILTYTLGVHLGRLILNRIENP
ncbi:hypothetical protein COLO4_21746 [Corchorus olitorius]|uniref:Uncharacterized protein n=1 Tax=Corchorus olitorius TaxID=93759 RepID=A0A1R3IRB6_9ROSI|nr:hypothetical protein COLO4_21746 [Corchorus olitorius]